LLLQTRDDVSSSAVECPPRAAAVDNIKRDIRHHASALLAALGKG